MKFAAKFLIISSLIFAVVALDKGQLHTLEKEEDDDNSDDYRRLQYLADCKIVKLKAGDFELLPNETLKVEAFNLTLNKTFFDVTNDSATICMPYYLDPNFLSVLVYEHYSVSILGLLLCLLFFATLEYDRLYLAMFSFAFFFYTLFAITEYLKGLFDTNEYKIPHELHFILFHFFFWMSTMTCDALILTTTGEKSRKRSPRKRISTLDLGQVLLFCCIRLLFVFTFLTVLDSIFPVWHSRFRVDATHYFLRVVITYGFLNAFNLLRLQICCYTFGYVEVLQRVLSKVLKVCLIFFNIIVFGWLLENYCIEKGSDTCRRFAFQFEIALVWIFVAAGVLKYYLDSRKFEKAAIVKKVTEKLKIAFAPKHENLEMEMA